MKKEIVKYHNDINSLNFKDFSALDLDILYIIFTNLKNKDTDKISLSIKDIKKSCKTGICNNKDFIEKVQEINKKLSSVIYTYEDESGSAMFVLFTTYLVNKEKLTLTVSVNSDFKYLFNNFAGGNFTFFELEKFINLKSKYAKNLYRNLMQWKSAGKYVTSYEELRSVLDCTDKYENKDFKRYCITKAYNELKASDYFEYLNIEYKMTGEIIFTFKIKEDSEQAESNNLPNTNFHKLEQRDYNFKEIEAKLLGK